MKHILFCRPTKHDDDDDDEEDVSKERESGKATSDNILDIVLDHFRRSLLGFEFFIYHRTDSCKVL